MTDTQVTGWVGWGWFAAIVLLIAGVIDAIYGLIAILMPGSAYFVAVEGDLFLFDVSGWGWWHLVIGIVLSFRIGEGSVSRCGWSLKS